MPPWSCKSLIASLYLGLAIYFLRKHRSGSRKNVTVIDRLIRGAIQMGVLPAVFTAAGLVAFGKSRLKTSICRHLMILSLSASPSATHKSLHGINNSNWALVYDSMKVFLVCEACWILIIACYSHSWIVSTCEGNWKTDYLAMSTRTKESIKLR